MSIDVTVWSITSISDNETYDDLKSLNIEPISLCFHNQISFQEVLISATSCLQLIRGQSWHQNQNSWARACVLTEDCSNTPNQIFKTNIYNPINHCHKWMVLGIIFHLLPKGYGRNISLLEASMDTSMYTLRSE